MGRPYSAKERQEFFRSLDGHDYHAGYRAGYEDAIKHLREHAAGEQAARGIATDYVRHVEEAADWLDGVQE